LRGNYGAGKTFFCSLVREEAWRRGFAVAAIDLGRDAPLHRLDVIYYRIMDALRTDHLREVPAFEFILQEWLFRLEQEVQHAMGLSSLQSAQRGEMNRVMVQRISEQLAKLRIYDRSFANAVCSFYEAAQQGHGAAASAAAGWLKGELNIPPEMRREMQLRGRVDAHNAFNFLQAVAALLVHIGYAGLIVIFDEVEAIRGISRPESRNAAYENIRVLLDTTRQGGFAHCGFLLAGTDDLYTDTVRGVASHRALAERLQWNLSGRRTAAFQQPLMALTGFDHRTLHEVARKVRDVHGVAYAWEAMESLTDDLLERLIEETAARVGAGLTTVPRGFLKGLVDILDGLQRATPSLAGALVAAGIDAHHIEAVECEKAHLIDHL
jgi:adenosylhomocysteinase